MRKDHQLFSYTLEKEHVDMKISIFFRNVVVIMRITKQIFCCIG